MKCSNPQFCARSNRLDGCCEPTAEHNIFVKIKSQMSGAITNHPPKINNDWQHGEVGCSESMFLGGPESVLMAHPNQRGVTADFPTKIGWQPCN
jgi:hypothetical protein